MIIAQSRSRPSTSSAASCGRCRMTQWSGWCRDRSRAASSSGLYAITLPASRPQEAETITFGRASSMRALSSAGAKPPNTTECTAPIRAQASIAIAASATIGR